MNCSGRITLFVVSKEKEGNKFNTFRGSFSSKTEDEKYESYSVDVYFDKEKFPKENTAKLKDGYAYQLEIEEGFLKVRSFQKDGKRIPTLAIVVQKGHLTGEPKKVAKDKASDSDLPF